MSTINKNEIFPLTNGDILRIVREVKSIDLAKVGEISFKKREREYCNITIEKSFGYYNITVFSHHLKYLKPFDYALHIDLAKSCDIPVPDYKILDAENIELSWKFETLKWYYSLILRNELRKLTSSEV